MATATTSAQLIREDRRDIIEDVRPGQHRQVRMREHNRPGDFREWAIQHPSACFRRFHVRDLYTYEIPTVSDVVTEEVSTQFEVAVAYPATVQFDGNGDGINGLEDAIRADSVLLENQLGAISYGDYPEGLNLFQLVSSEIEREEDVYFLVQTYDAIFHRAVVLDVLNLAGSAAITAAATMAVASAHVSNDAGVGAFSASATVAGAGTLGFSQVGAFSGAATVTAAAVFAAGGYDIDTITPANIATITGQAEPTLMWRGNDASGASELVVGTDDLVDVNSPTKQVTDATLGGDTTQMTTATQSMDAASSSVCDIGVETVTIIQIVRPTGFSGTKGTMGKRDTAGINQGYELKTDANGRFTWTVDSSTGVKNNTVTVDHGTTNAQVVCVTRQSGADRQGLWTREGSSVGTRNNETLTSTAIFALGAARVQCEPGFYGPCMVWIGTDGDFGDAAAFEAARFAIAEALGYES